MPTIHTVKQGECLSSIAKKYGFADWRIIYNYPQNAEFKRKRPNPNLIYPGDQLFIPDKELKQEQGQTEQRHRFRMKISKQVLRLAIEDPDGNRMANAPYTLVIDGHFYQGTTNGEGMLEEQIPVDARQGKLTIGEHIWDLLIAHLNPIEADTRDQGVSGAQGRLLNLGYDVGPIDGILGPRTKAALQQFQKDYGLPETGILDNATRAKLVEVHGC